MSDLQYRSYCAASYFYRPLYWDGSYWHFSIYARYPYRDFFYFGCPDFVVTYRGGHSWYHNGGRSWYYGRDWHAPRDGGRYLGMRTRFDRGNYGDGYARNYMLPRKLAVEATADNVNTMRMTDKAQQEKRQREREEAFAIATRMKNMTVTVKAKGGGAGRYGCLRRESFRGSCRRCRAQS